MNAVFLLIRDHFELSGLLRRFLAAALPERAAALSALREAWAAHVKAAGEVFYPALQGWALEARRRAEGQHADVAAIVEELAVLPDTDPRRAPRLAALREVVGRHVQEEQEDVFPEARKRVEAQVLADLGRRIQRLRAGESEPAEETELDEPPERLVEAMADVAQAMSETLHAALDLPPPRRARARRGPSSRAGQARTKRAAARSRRRP